MNYLANGDPVLGQQLAKAVGLVDADPCNHSGQLGERFHAIELAGAQQGVHQRGMPCGSMAGISRLRAILLMA